ncbi:hypothetical protein B484DRAFT_458629 [Ochromonadaceae sp. CCMP2298]|nr:hypothetical protein B484DRAFT_458629 [Ochromonadaceae sp. CCMP2298]
MLCTCPCLEAGTRGRGPSYPSQPLVLSPCLEAGSRGSGAPFLSLSARGPPTPCNTPAGMRSCVGRAHLSLPGSRDTRGGALSLPPLYYPRGGGNLSPLPSQLRAARRPLSRSRDTGEGTRFLPSIQRHRDLQIRRPKTIQRIRRPVSAQVPGDQILFSSSPDSRPTPPHTLRVLHLKYLLLCVCQRQGELKRGVEVGET